MTKKGKYILKYFVVTKNVRKSSSTTSRNCRSHSSSGQKSTNVHKMSLKEEKAIFYSALLLNLEEGETEKMPGKHSLVLTLPITVGSIHCTAPEKQLPTILAIHYILSHGSGQ